VYIHTSAKQALVFKAWEDRLMLELCGNTAGHMTKPGTLRAMNPYALNKKKNKKILPVFWKQLQDMSQASVVY
jgi:hypothetical protein